MLKRAREAAHRERSPNHAGQQGSLVRLWLTRCVHRLPAQVTAAEVTVEQKQWERTAVGGQAHDHGAPCCALVGPTAAPRVAHARLSTSPPTCTPRLRVALP